jgi:TolB-like protein
MPFTNLSSDKEQEFFSDGMTEEIVTALAKIPDLRVVARESAFQYKGAKNDMRAIGLALGATHLIEGSVRKAGDRVRIAAQLVKADDGVNVWANSYDRQLTDVFAVQEDIARAIATSLRMPLGLKPGENLVNNRSIDPEFYEKYLRAKALYLGRGGGLPNVAQAGELLQEIVAKYPNYAPAWALLGAVYFVSGSGVVGDVNKPIAEARAQANELRTKADAALQKAIQLDPNLAQAHTYLAVAAWSRGKPLEADERIAKALALDPTGELGHAGEWLAIAGRSKDALVHLEKAFAMEPFPPPGGSLVVVNARWVNGQNDAAIALAKTLRPIDRAPALARIYASMGRYSEAADALMEIASDPNSAAAQAMRLLRTAPAKTATPDRLPRLPQNLQFVYLYIGAPDRAIGAYERQAEIGYLNARSQTQVIWHPSYAAVRKTERFKALMKNVGLVDYWRAKGWPEQCHPTTGDDFACD